MHPEYFKDKVIVITGASSGIGLASARLFGSFGADVVMAARSLDRLQELAPSVNADPDKVLCVKTDVTKEDDCRNLIGRTVRKYGRIDILVNNAGISMRAMFKDLDLGVIRSLMDVNFWGYCAVHEVRFALPAPKQRAGCGRDLDRRIFRASGKDRVFSVEVRHPRFS